MPLRCPRCGEQLKPEDINRISSREPGMKHLRRCQVCRFEWTDDLTDSQGRQSD
jgi:hypothetical protein